MEINAQMVKELREKTGAGMMDCKKALSENGGDFTKAEEWLRKKGISKAASKGARIAAEGLVNVEVSGNIGVVVEVNSETDFVARNADFQKLVKELSAHVSRHAPTSLENLLEQSWTDGKKVKDIITEKVATIGENLSVRRFERYQAQGALGSYLHSNSRFAALVELACPPGAIASDDVKAAAKTIAMQITSMKPQWVDRTQVPTEILEKEKEIYRAELREAKKPEAIWDKILGGKLEKFYDQVCLVDQLWIVDDQKRIRDVLAETAKKVGGEVKVARYVRYEVGEGIEKKKDDLAKEVAKTLGQA